MMLKNTPEKTTDKETLQKQDHSLLELQWSTEKELWALIEDNPDHEKICRISDRLLVITSFRELTTTCMQNDIDGLARMIKLMTPYDFLYPQSTPYEILSKYGSDLPDSIMKCLNSPSSYQNTELSRIINTIITRREEVSRHLCQPFGQYSDGLAPAWAPSYQPYVRHYLDAITNETLPLTMPNMSQIIYMIIRHLEVGAIKQGYLGIPKFEELNQQEFFEQLLRIYQYFITATGEFDYEFTDPIGQTRSLRDCMLYIRGLITRYN